MIVEIVLREQPEIEPEGYEKIKLPTGIIYYSPVEKKSEILVKKHADGRVSVFTDNSDLIKNIAQKSEVIDIHIK